MLSKPEAVLAELKTIENKATQVTRGEKSWLSLISFWGMSVIVVNIINSSELVGNHKVVLSLLNLVVIIYLNFFNSYFRNKIIEWTIKAQQFEERV